MKKFKILQELSKCDKETGSEQMMLENGADTLAWPRVATNLKLVKMKYLWSLSYTLVTGLGVFTNPLNNPKK